VRSFRAVASFYYPVRIQNDRNKIAYLHFENVALMSLVLMPPQTFSWPPYLYRLGVYKMIIHLGKPE